MQHIKVKWERFNYLSRVFISHWKANKYSLATAGRPRDAWRNFKGVGHFEAKF